MKFSHLKDIIHKQIFSKKQILDLLSQLTKVTNKNGVITDDLFNHFFYILPSNHLIYVLYNENTHNSSTNPENSNKNNDFELIGIATILIERKLTHGGESCAHIEDVVIDSKYRGLSYGKYMIDFLIQKAKEYNCYKIILNCDEQSVGFYEKFGFQQKNVEMSLYVNHNTDINNDNHNSDTNHN